MEQVAAILLPTYDEDLADNVGRHTAELLSEAVKVLEVLLEERVADDLDVDLLEILLGETVEKVRRQWRVDDHRVVQLGDVVGDGQGRHALKHAQRVALCVFEGVRKRAVRTRAGLDAWGLDAYLGDEALCVLVVERASNQQADVVDHVRIAAATTSTTMTHVPVSIDLNKQPASNSWPRWWRWWRCKNEKDDDECTTYVM